MGEAVQNCSSEKVVFCIVGNKSDLENERTVSKDEIDNLSKEISVNYFETSAKTNQNVDNLFDFLAQKILEARNSISSDNSESINLKLFEKKKEKKCCSK